MTTELDSDYVTRKLRETRGRWTDVAEGSGVPVSTIRKLGQGQIKNPRSDTVRPLVLYFRRFDDFQAQNAAARQPEQVQP